MGADFTPGYTPQEHIGAFRMWCQKVLPLVYDDSLSYYEVLCKVTSYLNTVIQETNELGDDVTALHEAYVKLQGYVNSYFDNLDVQKEIDNKLDEMITDGTFASLYINSLKIFSSYSEFVSNISSIFAGNIVKILNYNDNDGISIYLICGSDANCLQLTIAGKTFYAPKQPINMTYFNSISEAISLEYNEIDLNGKVFNVTSPISITSDLELKNGELLITSVGLLANSNISIRIDSVTFNGQNTGYNGLFFTGCKSVEIEKCVFENLNNVTNTDSVFGVRLNQVEKCTINKCTFQNFTKQTSVSGTNDCTAVLSNNSNIEFTNNIVQNLLPTNSTYENIDYDGVNFQNGNVYVIKNNKFNNISGRIVKTQQSKGIIIGNHISINNIDTMKNFYVFDCQYLNAIIQDNFIEFNSNSPLSSCFVSCYGRPTTNNSLIVTGNKVDGNLTYGFNIIGVGGAKLIASNNIIKTTTIGTINTNAGYSQSNIVSISMVGNKFMCNNGFITSNTPGDIRWGDGLRFIFTDNSNDALINSIINAYGYSGRGLNLCNNSNINNQGTLTPIAGRLGSSHFVYPTGQNITNAPSGFAVNVIVEGIIQTSTNATVKFTKIDTGESTIAVINI